MLIITHTIIIYIIYTTALPISCKPWSIQEDNINTDTWDPVLDQDIHIYVWDEVLPSDKWLGAT